VIEQGPKNKSLVVCECMEDGARPADLTLAAQEVDASSIHAKIANNWKTLEFNQHLENGKFDWKTIRSNDQLFVQVSMKTRIPSDRTAFTSTELGTLGSLAKTLRKTVLCLGQKRQKKAKVAAKKNRIQEAPNTGTTETSDVGVLCAGPGYHQ